MGQAATLLGSNQDGDLFSINTTTGAGTLIGTSPITSTEIEFGQGELYSEPAGLNIDLFILNPSSGAVEGSLTHPCCALNGLEFVGNTLYGTNITEDLGPSTLVIVNTTTGEFTPVGPTGLGPISGLAYEASTSTMLGVTGGRDGVPFGRTSLVTISLETGVATQGPTLVDSATSSPLSSVGSIELLNGVLYAGISQSGDVNPGGLFRVDTLTGESTFIGNTGFSSITGLTVVPVPAAVWLLGSGLLGLIGIARKRAT